MCRLGLAMMLWVAAAIPLRADEGQPAAAAAVKQGAPQPRDTAAEEAWRRHGLSDGQREQIRAAFRWGIERKFVPGGVLLLVHRGEPIFREAFGVADIETGRPFAVDDPCRIASVTKPHTSTLIAMLVEQGKLSWDDPVDKHLPGFAGISVRGKGPASRSPKIRELLSHTSGFPGQKAFQSGQWRVKRDGTLAEAVDGLPGQGLATEPGSVFAYTGAGYMVAGRIAEIVTGKEFAALMKEMLLDPVGATIATFDPSGEIEARMPTMYQHQDAALVKLDRSSRPDAISAFPNPGGALISTLDDVGRVLLLHRNRGMANGKRLIAAESLAALYRGQPATGRDPYGLGFNVLKVGKDGVGVRVGHLGASGTQVLIDFENDLLIVLLTQVPLTETQPFRQRLLGAIYAVFQPPAAAVVPQKSNAASYDELKKMYDYDRALPLELQDHGTTERGGAQLHDISYASPQGGRVSAYLVVPKGPPPLAGLLFMHGGNGNRSSLLPGAITFAKTGAACLLIDSPLNGARARPGQPLADFSAPQRTRDAMIQTVVDLRRGVDLLTARPDVDPRRLAYLGASYGGTIGGVLAGVEHRIKAYVLLVGTGDLGDFVRLSPHPTALAARKALGEEQLQKNIDLLDCVQPIHYVGHAAPSALFFQNGRRDPFMPQASVARYHEAGSQPKKVQWYDAGHGLNAEAFRDRARWLREQIGIGPLPADALKNLGSENTN